MKLSKTMLSLGFLAASSIASAGTLPNPAIDNVQTYVEGIAGAGNYTELFNYDFNGEYAYTAIGYESGNQNTTSLTINGSASFDTHADSNFGEWQAINFSTDQLYFEDSDGPYNIALDPFSGPYFRLFELTSSTTVSYLDNLYLAAGTIIVGFGDGLGDSDYDDIIVALNPVPVPAAAFLFAPALMGFMGLRRKAKKTVA